MSDLSNLPPGVTQADCERGTWDDRAWDRLVDAVIARLAERGLDYYALDRHCQNNVYAAIERHAASAVDEDDAGRVGDAVYDDWCERRCA